MNELQGVEQAVYGFVRAISDSCLEFLGKNTKPKKKGIPKFNKNDKGIIFAFPDRMESDDPLAKEALEQEEIKQINFLHHDLVTEISKYKIQAKRVSCNNIPVNHDEAVDLLNRSNGALIIWGKVTSGNVKLIGGPVTEINEISYTFNFKDVSKLDGKALSNFIYLSTYGEKRIIGHGNDKEDRELIAKSIKDKSCYIVAVTLTLNKRFEEAYSIFNQLELEINQASEKSELNKIRLDSLKLVHAYAYFLESQNIGLPAFPSKTVREKVENLTNLIQITSDNAIFYSHNKAIINFWDRKIDVAMKFLDLAPDNYATYFNKAFLLYYENDIKIGWFYLKKAIKIFLEEKALGNDVIMKKKMNKFLKDLIIFYRSVIKNEQNKYLLLFPLSYIVYMTLGKKKAKKYAKQLLNNIKNLPLNTEAEKSIFKKRAQRMINGLE